MASTSIAQVFDDLAAKYNLSAEVRTWLTDANGLNAQRLEDFAYAMSSESEAQAIIAAAKVPTGSTIQQLSRVRQAWAGVRKAAEDAQKVLQRGSDETDLDVMLTAPQLDNIQDVFFRRYKVHYPSSVMPSEAVISRLSKEIDKKLLTLRDVWKVRTQAQLVRATRKTTLLTEGIEISHNAPQEDEAPGPQTIQVYMNKLFTLLLGYAVVGAKARSGAPASESRATDTVLFVDVPLDLVLKYFHRVKKYAESLPYSVALSKTQLRDEGERELWIDTFRGGGPVPGGGYQGCLSDAGGHLAAA